MRHFSLSIAGLLLGASTSWAAGFQTVSIPDPANPPLEAGIWYPSDAPTAPARLAAFSQRVATNGPVAGQALPLIVFSHGTGGSFDGHYDTALALADAGFIVVAMTHTGDNYRDHSSVGGPAQFTDRVRHVSRTLDWMLADWNGHDRIDPKRIGLFGFSAGGTTALIELGGVPDLSLVGPHCREVPLDPVCRYVPSATHGGAAPAAPSAPNWTADARFRAAVIAAPAIGFAFSSQSLAKMTVPIQLWRGSDDEVLLSPWHAETVHQALPPADEYRVVPHAGHYAFLAPCSDTLRTYAPEICADPAGFDRAAFHVELNRDIVAFFREKLAVD